MLCYQCPFCFAGVPQSDRYSPPDDECPGCGAGIEWEELPDDPDGRGPTYVGVAKRNNDG